MKGSDASTDKIFARPQLTIHYRRAARARWSSNARPDYTVLLALEGAWRWSAVEESGEMRGRGALLVAPGELININVEHSAWVTLTLAPALILDAAIRSRLTRGNALITFRSPAINNDERLVRLADDLAEEMIEEADGQEVVVAAIVEQIVVHLLRRHAHIRRSDELELSRAGLVDRRIRRAVELMHTHLDRDLPLEEIAAAAYPSPFHFARLFKKLTGAPPHAYLAALRAARAKTLLTESDFSVTEIAARVGYSSSSHFSKAFRQATGLSPRAFRAAITRH
ncbi:MAG TPA: helix-turn-helix domain-containing protein [Pyrinomonadaceae bacterium]|jgi:AraC family transcriptional regulator|nr:helix-turn-helix domain-containing protein [Pyrinomonadaceae bacterium]